MNVISRGIKNALRSPLRSGAIVLMLAISIGLILSMLVARSSVNAKINEVKATAGTNITISPAGVMGFAGGGDALTNEQLTTIKKTAHISSTSATLSDQMSKSDTNLTASLELGGFGARQQRFEGGSATTQNDNTKATDTSDVAELESTRPAPTPRTMVTGTTNPNSVSTDGSDLTLTSGQTIDGKSDELIALIGSDLATKNSLTVGKTFTAYDKTITVKGIFNTDNKFQDSGVIMQSVALLQKSTVAIMLTTLSRHLNHHSVIRQTLPVKPSRLQRVFRHSRVFHH
jgi:putative ABC transport system permease protein